MNRPNLLKERIIQITVAYRKMRNLLKEEIINITVAFYNVRLTI